MLLFQTGWGPMLWASQVSGSPDAKTDQGKENRRKIVHHLLKAGVDVNKAGKVSTLRSNACCLIHVHAAKIYCCFCNVLATRMGTHR